MLSGGLRTKGVTKSPLPGQPLISVVTVVYNGAATLERTVQSVLGQSYGNVEYIIIDGGSTDGTLDIIRQYEGRIDLWRSGPDKGIYDAMNRGIELATGDFLIFLGADDTFLHPEAVARCSGYMADPGTVYYGDVYFSRSRVIYDYAFSALKLCCMNICHQGIFYCRGGLRDLRFDLGYPIYADWKLNIELWARKPFAYMPETVSVFSEGGVSGRGDAAFERDRMGIIRRNFGLPMLARYLLLRRLLAPCHFVGHIIASHKHWRRRRGG